MFQNSNHAWNLVDEMGDRNNAGMPVRTVCLFLFHVKYSSCLDCWSRFVADRNRSMSRTIFAWCNAVPTKWPWISPLETCSFWRKTVFYLIPCCVFGILTCFDYFRLCQDKRITVIKLTFVLVKSRPTIVRVPWKVVSQSFLVCGFHFNHDAHLIICLNAKHLEMTTTNARYEVQTRNFIMALSCSEHVRSHTH